jgi:hypothetical protein
MRPIALFVLLSAQLVVSSPAIAQRSAPRALTAASVPRGADSTRSSAPRWAHAKRGAVVGAILGAAIGVTVATQIGVGCKLGFPDSDCPTAGTRLQLAAWFGGMGAVALGLVGALIGAAFP